MIDVTLAYTKETHTKTPCLNKKILNGRYRYEHKPNACLFETDMILVEVERQQGTDETLGFRLEIQNQRRWGTREPYRLKPI